MGRVHFLLFHILPLVLFALGAFRSWYIFPLAEAPFGYGYYINWDPRISSCCSFRISLTLAYVRSFYSRLNYGTVYLPAASLECYNTLWAAPRLDEMSSDDWSLLSCCAYCLFACYDCCRIYRLRAVKVNDACFAGLMGMQPCYFDVFDRERAMEMPKLNSQFSHRPTSLRRRWSAHWRLKLVTLASKISCIGV